MVAPHLRRCAKEKKKQRLDIRGDVVMEGAGQAESKVLLINPPHPSVLGSVCHDSYNYL